MNMSVKRFIEQRKAKKLFPRFKKDFWYCYEFNDYQYELMKQGKPYLSTEIELPCGRLLINPFKDHNQIQKGAVLPMMKMNGWVAFYKITKMWMYASRGSDFAPWDDGQYVNLELDHIEREIVVVHTNIVTDLRRKPVEVR